MPSKSSCCLCQTAIVKLQPFGTLLKSIRSLFYETNTTALEVKGLFNSAKPILDCRLKRIDRISQILKFLAVFANRIKTTRLICQEMSRFSNPILNAIISTR